MGPGANNDTRDAVRSQEARLRAKTNSKLTLFPTTSVSPPGAQARVKVSPRPRTSLKQFLVLTSQKLDSPITADTAEFRILDWVEGHFLYWRRMTLEVC